MKNKTTIALGAMILAISSSGSYGFGLLRDRLLAGHFGAGFELDIYNASFLLPDFIMSSFSAALTSAFVPIFVYLYFHQGKKKSWQFTNSVLSLLSLVMIIGVIIAAVVAPWFTRIIAPGFDEEKHTLLVQTTRLMLISPLLFSLSTLFGSALQGLRKFISYALSPILYNLGIILGIVLFSSSLGVFGPVIGVLIGASLHLCIRLVEIILLGWRLSYRDEFFLKPWREPEIKKTIRLILPRAADLLIWQVNLWSFTAIASTITIGSIAIFNLARNFQSMPVSLFGIAFATSMFPALATAYARKDLVAFSEDLTKTIKQVLFFTIPASAGMIVLSQSLINFFLANGKFTSDSVAITGLVLTIFAIAIPLESIQYLLTRGFYSQHNTKTPVFVTIIATLVNISICLISSHFIGVAGLALGFISYCATQVILLTILLKKKLLNWKIRTILVNLIKILIAASIMASIIYFIKPLFINAKLYFLSAVCLGAIIYVCLAFLLRLPEISAITLIINKKILKR